MSDSSSTPAAGPDPLIGGMVGGRYRIEKELGRGGMGVVYVATQTELDRQVAIKVLFQSSEPRSEERLLREARAAGSIGHPNVVDVYDLGRLADGRPFVVMPLLEGRDVADELHAEGLPAIQRAVWIVSEAAKGLDVLHKKGLVHRDLKPENLFLVRHVDGTEALKILDFGLATRLEDVRLTHTGLATGSPHYMPPEAADGSVPDKRGDVYSLASVAYELLSGFPVFDADSAFRILTEKTTRDAPRLSRPERPFPPEVEAVMARALARAPGDRFDSAGAFAAALEHAMSASGAVRAAVGRRGTLEVESPLFAPREIHEAATLDRASDDALPLVTPKQQQPYTVPTRRAPMIAAIVVAVSLLATGIAYVAWPSGLATSSGGATPNPAPAPTSPSAPAAGVTTGATATHLGNAPLPAPTPAAAEPVGATPATPSATHAPSHHRATGTATATATGTGTATVPATVTGTVPATVPATATATETATATGTATVPATATTTATETATARPHETADAPDLARAEALTRAATRALMQGTLGDALAQFRDATIAAPRHAPAWRGLGLTSERLDRNPEAVRAYRRYLGLAPNAADADEIRARVARLGG